KNTVGKLIEGKTPKQIEKIRILDPACGSGSFLIGAFQCLIEYHTRYLAEHPKEAHIHSLFPDLLKDDNGEPRLSVVRNARIVKAGGFDCVIGNPPYVRQESLSEFKDYFEEHYDSFDGVADLYVYFMEKGIRLLRKGGYYSIIVSSSFLRTTFATRLREFLKK